MIAKGNGPLLPLDEVRTHISDFEILRYYLGVTSVPTVINNPTRKDERPSLGIYTSNGQTVAVRDIATGYSNSLVGFLAELWHTNLEATLAKIITEIPLISKGNNSELTISKSGRHSGSKAKIQVKIREWKKYDLEYWDSYGISLPWLKFGKVFPISHIFIEKEPNKYVIPAEKYAYVYIEQKDNITSIKIYQPFSKDNKWYNNHSSSVWDLWSQLPMNGDNLIITSSRKDALCIWENTGIPSCSLQAESYWPKPHVVDELKNRFHKIFILYDNDFNKEVNHGRLYGSAMAKQFGLTQIEIPIELKSKDSSDLCKMHGREILHQTILKLIQHESTCLWHP